MNLDETFFYIKAWSLFHSKFNYNKGDRSDQETTIAAGILTFGGIKQKCIQQ